MKGYRFLKWARVALSLFVLVGISWYFVAVQVTWAQGLSLLLKVQFLPALLSSMGASILALASILLLTLLFGRIYCSLLCPLGVFQDVVIRISHLFKTKKKRRFHYSKGVHWLRYAILTFVTVGYLVGFSLPLLLLDPYSNFGRMASRLFKPVVQMVNNGIHYIWPNAVFYQSFSTGSVLGWILPAAILLIVVGMSAFRGRLLCNSLCPVGSFLGVISRYAVFRPMINKKRCNHCSLCAQKCKAACINSKAQEVDHSRCVACFDCTLACTQNAITYTFSWRTRGQRPLSLPTLNPARRTFLAAAGTALGAAAVYRSSGTPLLTASSAPSTIAPPGARSHAHLKAFCTACQACVAACPAHIIEPTLTGYGFDGWMLPAISYQKGFCTYACNRCSQVCPNAALERTTLEEKKLIQIGKAKLTLKHCVAIINQTDCGACDEHCPTKAVHMVPYGTKGLLKPVIDEEYCIGCGGCEYICPATPKAIVVQAQAVHETALLPAVEKQAPVTVDDFGF